MKDENAMREKWLSTTEVYNGRILNVLRDDIELPDGKKSIREVVRHIGAVCVIPVFDDGTVIMEHQYRYPLDRVILEIPAGKLDSPDEDRLDAAKRELKEETGITADNWLDMGLFYGTPAYSDEKITMYLATGLHEGERKLDEGEFIELERMPLAELVDEVLAGRITDGKTQLAVLKTDALIRRGLDK